jgi:hypothetical protein
MVRLAGVSPYAFGLAGKRAILDIIELGEPDASGRRSPVATGRDVCLSAVGDDVGWQ